MTNNHGSIFRSLYVQGQGALRQELKIEVALQEGRTTRLPKSKIPARAGRGNKTWVHGAQISQTPATAEEQAIPGQWEGDVLLGRGDKSALIMLTERQSRFVLIRRLDTADTALTIAAQFQEMIDRLNRPMTMLSWDREVDMAKAKEFSVASQVDVFFADPHSPWHKGSAGQVNRDIRWYFPTDTRFNKVSDEQIHEVQTLLNHRAFLVLDSRTPEEVLWGTLSGAYTP